MTKKSRKTESEIRDAYSELEPQLEALMTDFLEPYETEYKERTQSESDEKETKAWLLGLLLTKRWKQYRRKIAALLTTADVSSAQSINSGAQNAFLRAFTAAAGEINVGVKTYTLKAVFRIYSKDALRYLQTSKKIFPVRKIPEDSATAWHESQIQKIMQSGIVQGKSIDKLAQEVKTVCKMSARASIRASRTAMTGAHGAGAQAAFETAEEKGIDLEKEWMSTYDNRTRDSHAEMDGERVPIDDIFSNGCKFPGDPDGEPGEVWNCRCTMRAIIKGINEEARYGSETYGRH